MRPQATSTTAPTGTTADALAGTPFDGTEVGGEIAREVDRILAGLSENSSCLVTGSIVEGLGNKHSDIDVYVVHGENAGENSIAVGMRASRYVDCEYMTLGSLDKLEARISGCTVRELPDLPVSAIDRYYRVAIALRPRVAPGAETVLDRFDRDRCCAVFSDWSALNAFQLLSRGAARLAQGAEREAGTLLRYAALWLANRELAADGEGYPSRKWTPDKAARRYGRDSDKYQELLEDLFDPPGGVAALAERIRTRAALPAPLAAALASRTAEPAPQLRHIPGPDRDMLVRGRNQVAEVDGTAAAICRSLARGADWAAATEELAAQLNLPQAEAAAAAWHETAPLRAAGLLVAVPGPASDSTTGKEKS